MPCQKECEAVPTCRGEGGKSQYCRRDYDQLLKPYFEKKINRNFSGYSSKIDEAKVEASGSLEIIAMTVTSALSQLTGAGKRCACGNRLRVITYLHPEIGGVLQNRLMIFIDVLNAAETNCANLLSRLQPG